LDKMSATEKEDVSPICYEKFHINWLYFQLAQKKPLFGVPFTSEDNLKAKGMTICVCNKKIAKAGGILCDKDAEIVKR
jgi:hypothetical protein